MKGNNATQAWGIKWKPNMKDKVTKMEGQTEETKKTREE